MTTHIDGEHGDRRRDVKALDERRPLSAR